MTVSVPRLQRIEPSANMPANDRVNFQAQDQASNILNRTQQMGQVVEKGADIYQQYENEKIDHLSYETKREYEGWAGERLKQLQQFQGDPTEAYAQFDKEAQEKYNEILASRGDVSERVKRHVGSRLQKSFEDTQVGALKQRGAQIETYKHNNFEAALKGEKDKLPVMAGYIRKNETGEYDRGSFFMYDKGLQDMKTMIAKRAVEQGTATLVEGDGPANHQYQDEDGKIVRIQLGDVAKQRVAKELSESIKTSIDVALAEKSPESLQLAKKLAEEYKGYIDPMTAAKVKGKFETADVKQKAGEVLASIKGKLNSEQRKQLADIQDPELRLLKSQEFELEAINNIKNEKLKNEVLKLKTSSDEAMKKQMKMRQDANYDALSKNVDQMIEQGAINGIADLENSEVYSMTWDNLSPKQRQEITERIKSPTKSNPNALAKVTEALLEGKISQMSEAEFKVNYLNGLSKEDKEKFSLIHKEFGKPTATAQRKVMSDANKFLKEELLNAKLIKYESGSNTKLRKGSKDTLSQAQAEILEIMATEGGSDPSRLQDHVRKYVAAKKKKEVYNPEKIDIANTFAINNRSNAISPQVRTPTQNEFKNGARIGANGKLQIRSDADFAKWQNQYETQYGIKVTTDAQKRSVAAWIAKQLNK
jgi:hypothetical protein